LLIFFIFKNRLPTLRWAFSVPANLRLVPTTTIQLRFDDLSSTSIRPRHDNSTTYITSYDRVTL